VIALLASLHRRPCSESDLPASVVSSYSWCHVVKDNVGVHMFPELSLYPQLP